MWFVNGCSGYYGWFFGPQWTRTVRAQRAPSPSTATPGPPGSPFALVMPPPIYTRGPAVLCVLVITADSSPPRLVCQPFTYSIQFLHYCTPLDTPFCAAPYLYNMQRLRGRVRGLIVLATSSAGPPVIVPATNFMPANPTYALLLPFRYAQPYGCQLSYNNRFIPAPWTFYLRAPDHYTAGHCVAGPHRVHWTRAFATRLTACLGLTVYPTGVWLPALLGSYTVHHRVYFIGTTTATGSAAPT